MTMTRLPAWLGWTLQDLSTRPERRAGWRQRPAPETGGRD